MKKVNLKTLKWILPVPCYFIAVGFFFFWDAIEILIFGVRYSDTPIILPGSFLSIAALPLIPLGYVLLAIGQWLYRKSWKWFSAFAWGVAAVSIILLIIVEYQYIVSWLYFLLIVVPALLFYYVPFFLSLSYLLKREKYDLTARGK
ncbi:MAG: hypothetical protein LBO71_07515 [Prevotellaceae bacterium]|jgi:hypothetical protein|nr:hypothetical protein [Prevotellaceae bacterium]